MGLLVSLLVGFCLSGGQKANNALSVYFYPVALRSTGRDVWSIVLLPTFGHQHLDQTDPVGLPTFPIPQQSFG